MTIHPQVELYPSLLLLTFALLGIACLVARLTPTGNSSLKKAKRVAHLKWPFDRRKPRP
jgi:ABC-type uncharacterized transport system permease subunit